MNMALRDVVKRSGTQAKKRQLTIVAVCTFVLVFAATELVSRPQHAAKRMPARKKLQSVELQHYGELVSGSHGHQGMHAWAHTNTALALVSASRVRPPVWMISCQRIIQP